MLRTTGTGWRCEAAELQYICSKKQVESGKVQRTEILQISRCQYFGAPHLVVELQGISYKYQRCSAPENACLIQLAKCCVPTARVGIF